MASPASPSTGDRHQPQVDAAGHGLIWWWAGVFAAGVALRVLAAYPSFRSPLESEITKTGLDALAILRGHARLGSPESWLHVPALFLFGATRGTLFLAPLAAGTALLAAFAFLACELLGEREGLAAFALFAVPPPMVLLWSSLPGGGAGTLFCLAAALGCAVRIGRRGAVPWVRSPRALGLAVALLAGALLWISVADAGRFAGRFAVGTADLLLRRDCPRPAFFVPLVATAGALYLAALGLALVRVRFRPALLLPLLVIVCTGFWAASAAGGAEGDTVRSVLPLCLAAPLLMAGLWGLVSARSHAAGDALLLLLLVVNAAGYCLPWTPRRQTERRLARAEDHLLYLLEDRRTAWVFGRSRDVYALNFLSDERIKAIPDLGSADPYAYERTLDGSPGSPAPFALVSRQRGKVAAWARRAGLQGELVNVNNDFEVFFPAPAAESPAALIARLRRGASQP
jgi:hypothetical protein